MRLSKQLFPSTLKKPERFSSKNTESVMEDAFFQKLDAGFLYHSPIITSILQRVNQSIITLCQDAGFDQMQTPGLTPIDLVKKSGKFETYTDEFFIAGNKMLPATTEEYLLALCEKWLISHTQLPLRLFEEKEAFRNIKRPRGILKTKQFWGIVISSLDKSEDDRLKSEKIFQEIMDEVAKKLNITLVLTEKFHGIEYVYPYLDGEKFVKNGFETFFGTSVAMGYPYTWTDCFKAPYHTPENTKRPVVMGTYGIGSQRCLFACMDANRDEHGFNLPREIRPYEHAVIVLNPEKLDQQELSDQVFADLKYRKLTTYIDDRNTTLKEKLDFADFIGVQQKNLVGPRECISKIPTVKTRK